MEIINENISTHLKKMYEEKLYCDSIIKIGDTKFHVHKAYLASCNQFFANLFSRQFKEGSQQEISLKEISPHIFQYLLEYLYLGKISVKSGDLLELHCQSSYFMVFYYLILFNFIILTFFFFSNQFFFFFIFKFNLIFFFFFR